LADFLARRYRVSEDVTFDLVSFAHAAGHQLGLDPLLIIAVMAVESRFNPIAESVAGAKGLMQVIPKYHPEKLQEYGGEGAVFDPRTNILVGSQILKEYLRRTGSMNAALQMYAGAANDEQDVYTTKVMNEKQRLQHVVNQSKRKAVRVARVSPLSE
jgi:soluble lytic murein transglycosylase-like protein